MDTCKRIRSEAVASGGVKKSKQEPNYLSSGTGSKLKPCMKFFSTAGCPFGESCHFLHYFPGGYNTVAKIMNLEPTLASRNVAPQSPCQTAPLHLLNPESVANITLLKAVNLVTNAVLLMANGNLGSLLLSLIWILVPLDPSQAVLGVELNILPAGPAAASFGALSTAKISVDASLAGAVIGKEGRIPSRSVGKQELNWPSENMRPIVISGTLNSRVHLNKSTKLVLWLNSLF